VALVKRCLYLLGEAKGKQGPGMAKLNIGEVVSDTFVTIAEYFVRALPLGLVIALMTGVQMYYNTNPFVNPGAVFWIATLIGMVASLLLVTALLRGMVRDEWDGIANIKLGRDEANVLVSGILYSLLWMLIALAIFVPLVLACMAVMFGGGFDFQRAADGGEAVAAQVFTDFLMTPGGILTLILFTLGLLAIFAAAMRGAAYSAGAIDQRRVVALEAFSWTKGNTLRLLAITAGLFIPLYIVAWVGDRIGNLFYTFVPELFGGTASFMSPLQLISAGTIKGLFLLPITIGGAALAAEIYKRVKPDAVNADDFD